VGLNDNDIQICNITTGMATTTLTGHTSSVLSLKVLNSNGTLLASGSLDTNIFIWNLTTKQNINQLIG